MSDDLLNAQNDLARALVEARLLLPSGVPGLFGRGTVLEDVIERIDALVVRTAEGDGARAERWRFPPILPRALLEKSEYLSAMPQLAGSVHAFDGTVQDHQKLLARVHGGEDYGDLQKQTDVALVPAACYPVYPIVASDGPLREGGRLVDVFSYCFRHEPSPDPARLQSFRMHEYVRIAPDADDARAFRDGWIDRGLLLLRGLGLAAERAPANDPFFGRAGKLLAVNQRDQELKFELVCPITSAEKPTALASANYHQDHFGSLFGITNADGTTAHTACVGFGVERVAIALFKTHGIDVAAWPVDVRARLWAP